MAGGSTHDAAFVAKLDRRTRHNEKLLLYFILSMLAILLFFTLLHLARRPGGRQEQEGEKPCVVTRLSRSIRSVTLRSAWGLPSLGHVIVVGVYVVVNLVIAFANLGRDDLPMITNVASRTAWLAMGNLIFVVLLALKNTPLAFLTAWSYERLNVLHRVAGYTTVALVVIHASCYSSYFVRGGRTEVLRKAEQIYGMLAGISFVLLAVAGAVVRRWWYELFYYLHVTFWIVAVVTLGLHQPDLGEKAVVVTALVGAGWALDRLVRLARFAIYCPNNRVELAPLPNRGTRVTLAKAPAGAVSGKHCFLWIPGIRACEAHPFTVVALDPLEFVVSSCDGFTHDLHRYALSHPGSLRRASVDGTYGTVPDPAAYDTVVLVAGGTGASFTFGVALDMLQKLRDGESKHVVFVWAAKHSSHLDCFQDHLVTLRNDRRVSISLFVTRQAEPPTGPSSAAPQPADGTSTRTTGADAEKGPVPSIRSQDSGLSMGSEKASPACRATPSTTAIEVQPQPQRRPAHIHGIPIAYERPDVPALVRAALAQTPAHRRAVVLGCGPGALMKQVRNTTAASIRPEGPGVELHCEQFGW
ncbi:hypothetical protein CDD83_4975 [Cordyceps sp. RAO-2017]|nr:hypothetical protein CDD83_4975 [Cordyceps sp. RAO-2017]